MTKSYEHLVPISEFGLERMSGAELEAWSGLAGVTVQTDYLNRPSVSLADAYKVAESRRRAEQEWNEAESRRRVEHSKAVKALQARVNAEFEVARTALLAANIPGLFGGQVERDGSAVNAGLTAAREVWAAAPAAVRDEVEVVQYEESGVIITAALNLALPLGLISEYAHKSARKY